MWMEPKTINLCGRQHGERGEAGARLSGRRGEEGRLARGWLAAAPGTLVSVTNHRHIRLIH
jgi:hypothetical protein